MLMTIIMLAVFVVVICIIVYRLCIMIEKDDSTRKSFLNERIAEIKELRNETDSKLLLSIFSYALSDRKAFESLQEYMAGTLQGIVYSKEAVAILQKVIDYEKETHK